MNDRGSAPQGGRVGWLITNHLGVVLSAGVVLLLTVRIYGFSHGSADTFVGLLNSGGTVDVLLPLLLNSLANATVILPFLAMFLIRNGQTAWLRHRPAQLMFFLASCVPGFFLAV